MRNRYTALVQRDGKWFIAFCPEVPEANGQGNTRQECLESLAAAIELVLDYKREHGLEKATNGTARQAATKRGRIARGMFGKGMGKSL
jgi:predicted RNase H-like HicB family nuclease